MDQPLPLQEPLPADLVEAARNAANALSQLQRVALSHANYPSGQAPPSEWRVNWNQELTANDLAEQAWSAAREAAAETCVLRLGRVYCYNCKQTACDCARPESDTQVFGGYQDTGRPRWVELFNYLADLGDTRVDQLFSQHPRILARVVSRKRLIADQLESFGRRSMTYFIVGQVVAGYLRIRRQSHVLTVQVVETSDRQLHCQLVAQDIVLEALTEAAARKGSTLYRIYNALQETKCNIRALNVHWRGAKGKAQRRKLQDKIFCELRHLANSIEQKGRQSERRTAHAELRGQQQRPVHKAFDDLAQARPESLFNDTAKESIIVVGRGGRSHVFSRTGRHITSFVIPGDKLDRRQRRRRYVPLTAEQRQQFLNAVAEQNAAMKEAG